MVCMGVIEMIEPMVEIPHQDYRNLMYISGFLMGIILGGGVMAMIIHIKGEYK